MNRNNEPSPRNGDFYEVIKHTGLYIVISLAVYILSALCLNFVIAIVPALCVFLLLFLTDEIKEVKQTRIEHNMVLSEQIFADTAAEMLEMRQHFCAFFLASTKNLFA